MRHAFRTFPFADASRCWDTSLGVEVVDIGTPPGRDESAFLVDLQTAVCRPSLPLAPGALYTAPAVSGAGSGKGLLVRATCMIAFGISPRAFTTGGERHELEKRLAAELMEAHPAVFLDNANGLALRSDTLASVLTERPARVRVLGRSLMVPLNSTAFIAVTGNGLTVTEDLARRFIPCELDARCEDPESRPFASGFLNDIERRRAELLAAVLTIWRWGRQNAARLTRGKPLGSYEMWAEWCRDPLLTLGCRDPVERIEALKANDPRRQRIARTIPDVVAASRRGNHEGQRSRRTRQGDRRSAGTRAAVSRNLSFRACRHSRRWLRAHPARTSRQVDRRHLRPHRSSRRRTRGHRTHRTDGPDDAAVIRPDESYGSYARCRRQRRRTTRRRGGDMSVARNLLEDLAVIGATIKPAGDRLILRAGRTAIPAELVSRVRAAKADLLATLAAGADRSNRGRRGQGARSQAPHDRTGHRTIESRIVEWLNQHPAPSAPGHCAWCGRPESPSAVVLPFGTEPETHAWLHAECWPDWHRARRAEAAATVAAMKPAERGAPNPGGSTKF